MVQVELLQSMSADAPRAAVQVELEQVRTPPSPAARLQREVPLQLTSHPSPQRWLHARALLQLSVQGPAHCWAHALVLLQVQAVRPASSALHEHEPPSHLARGPGWTPETHPPATQTATIPDSIHPRIQPSRSSSAPAPAACTPASAGVR
jgi:hypothetical protein